MTFDSCFFTKNLAIRGSISRVENNGYFTIRNSIIEDNHAVLTSISSIIDCLDTVSEFNNSTLTYNTPVKLEFVLSNLPDIVKDALLEKDLSAYQSLFISQNSINVMKGELLISNGTQLSRA